MVNYFSNKQYIFLFLSIKNVILIVKTESNVANLAKSCNFQRFRRIFRGIPHGSSTIKDNNQS
jgi:hypothetical protein